MIPQIRKILAYGLLACGSLSSFSLWARPNEFSFGVFPHAFRNGQQEAVLRNAIIESDADNLAFVVANGIKSWDEPCSDALYRKRKKLLMRAKNGLIVSIAGTDWASCVDSKGESAAFERLNRIRELFFADEFSFGSSRIPLIRQSATAKFRSYAENMRWEVGGITFGTVNVPANNNYYRAEAGRNSEFEDRMIANRGWLERIFAVAKRKKSDGIVLFCDGDPLVQHGFFDRFDLQRKRDGFVEMRRYITQLAENFEGRVLLVYSHTTDEAPAANDIVWRDNIGKVAAPSGWLKLTVSRTNPALFQVADRATHDMEQAAK
jgi:hypothetical protein